MKKYLVDLHRLRHNPYNGLYSFSCRLAEHLQLHTSAEEQLYYYLPADKIGMFGDKPQYVTHRRRHKFYQAGTGRYDIWHLTTGISQYRPFSKKPKVVFTIHDVNFLIEEPDNKKRNSRTLTLMQRNADRADHIVGISKHALEAAAKVIRLGNKPTSVVYNGHAVKTFPGFDEPIYRPPVPFLFSISLVQPRKNFHILPPLLQGNDYELIIAGLNHFDYAKQVMEEARKWKVEDRVKLIGPVDDQNKYWYLKNCSAFLFPSIAEGFGIPPVEAMQFGKPVFLSDKTSLPEIGGDAAYYFKNFEPEMIQQVFREGMSDHTANNRSAHVRNQAEKFTWDDAARKYLAIYRSLT